MATVVLNIATELSIEYDIRNIEVSLVNTIQTKADLAMKYAQELNKTWSWFVDVIWCPDGVTMSGTTARTTWISTTLSYTWATSTVYCQGTHNGDLLIFYFDPSYSDIKYAQYVGYQVSVNSGSTTATFSDSDSTFIDITWSYPLSSDGIDDNFDSDDYSIYSTGTTYYPDNYIDNDADSRLLTYGYIIENSGLYNIFWSNSQMKNYIDANTHNSDSIHTTLNWVSSGRLYLDINRDHRLILYRIDPSTYNDTKEFLVNEYISGTWQLADIWYLQDDMSISSSITGSEYDFDFTSYDYALFLENTSSWALLYRIRGEDTTSGSGVYLSALQDDDTSVLWYLWSHLLIDDTGRLVWNQIEVFGLK